MVLVEEGGGREDRPSFSPQRASVCSLDKNKNRKKNHQKTQPKISPAQGSSPGSILSLTSPVINKQLPAKSFKG